VRLKLRVVRVKPIIPKFQPLRSRVLLDLAHQCQECQHCGRWVEGCEPAHPNWAEFGKAGARKGDDIHAALCHDCHALLDQGRLLSREERREMWMRAALKTWALYMKNGWLRVA